jgi:hypothetical protein
VEFQPSRQKYLAGITADESEPKLCKPYTLSRIDQQIVEVMGELLDFSIRETQLACSIVIFRLGDGVFLTWQRKKAVHDVHRIGGEGSAWISIAGIPIGLGFHPSHPVSIGLSSWTWRALIDGVSLRLESMTGRLCRISDAQDTGLTLLHFGSASSKSIDAGTRVTLFARRPAQRS